MFEGVMHGQNLTVGPAPAFRISGNFLRQGPAWEIAGEYKRHHWEVQGRHFTRWLTQGTALVHFEDAAGGATEDFGPFESISTSDGVMYCGKDLFAKFLEESQLWHCYVTETFWPVLIVKNR
jgi:hypothetical protein